MKHQKNFIPDERIRRYVIPSRIIDKKGDISNAEILLKKNSGQATIWTEVGALLPPQSSILLDYGCELHGGVQLITGRTPEEKICPVRIRFGESVAEAQGFPDNTHAMHDTVIELASMSANEYGNTAFRFAMIDNLSDTISLELREARAVFLFRDIPWRGSFESDDKLLNEIWHTGAYTVQLCMQDYIWDGAKRDRLVWMGDMHPELMTVAAVFGKQRIIEESMDLVRNETVLPKMMNGFVTYSLWWIIAQYDWFYFYGDMNYLQQQREYLVQLLRILIPQIDSTGKEHLNSGERLLDWANYENDLALHVGHQALLTISLNKGMDLCRVLVEPDCVRSCGEALEKMTMYKVPDCDEKSPNALLVLAGLVDPVVCNQNKLAINPLKNISTFHGYYVLEARALAGDYAGCLDLIRRYWGTMIELGATTFWEHFDIEWARNAGRIDELPAPEKINLHATYGSNCYTKLRNSLCHGWSGGPTAWLSHHILGVNIATYGSGKICISPHMPGLKEVCGTFPTQYGDIQIEHEKKKDGKIISKITTPDEIEIIEMNNCVY